MRGPDVIAKYEAAWQLTHRMLETARNNDWDSLIVLEKERGILIVQLMEADKNEMPEQILRQTKADLISKILSADDEIASLTKAWMGEISEVLSSVNAGKKLEQAYNTSNNV